MPQPESPRATTREKPVGCNEEPTRHNERSRMLQLRPDAVKINQLINFLKKNAKYKKGTWDSEKVLI